MGLLPTPKGSSSQGFLTALWFELSSQIMAHFSTVWLRPSRAVGTAPVEQKEAGRRPGQGGGGAKVPNEQNSDGLLCFPDQQAAASAALYYRRLVLFQSNV